MSQIDDIGHELSAMLKYYDADYLEAHLEERQASRINYRGKELESAGRETAVGGNIRAMVNGGWGFVSFNSFDNMVGKIQTAIKQAKFTGKEKTKLAEVKPATDKVRRRVNRNAIKIPLAEKKALLDEYNRVIWSVPNIQTSVINYSDGHKRTIYLNSAGSYIDQERNDAGLRISGVAAANGDVQQVSLSLGSVGDFSKIEGLHGKIKEAAENAVKMLSAPQVKGGEYTVVLDPILAGVFVHEAFGHLSESDFVYENDQMREIMVLGKQFGGPELNIVDGGAVPGYRGSFKYDDEGVPATKTYLIREGKLTGRLHSRETAAKMGEQPTGNARAISHHFPPIVRMTNTYIEPRKMTFQDIIADIKEGVYAKNWYGGQTSMEMFTFSAAEAYMIRNGKIEEQIRPVMLTGNVFQTLMNIDAIGNDLDMNEGGGCGKGGQSPLPVSNGSPHIRIQRCLVGGK